MEIVMKCEGNLLTGSLLPTQRTRSCTSLGEPVSIPFSEGTFFGILCKEHRRNYGGVVVFNSVDEMKIAKMKDKLDE